MLSDVYENAEDFDVIHSHIDYWSFAFARLSKTPTVSTMHGRLDLEDLKPIYARYRTVPLVSISDGQRTPVPFMNWVSTIHHGLPRDLLTYSKGPGKYLAFLGRISPEKRPDLAIDIARKAGIPIKLAAKVDVVDRAYFDQVIKPRLSPPDVEYIGEINESQKNEFLGNALALMFTIDWPEPFGLAMIEALACGTPVIARPCVSRYLRFCASASAELSLLTSTLSCRRCRWNIDRVSRAGLSQRVRDALYRGCDGRAVRARLSQPDPRAPQRIESARAFWRSKLSSSKMNRSAEAASVPLT